MDYFPVESPGSTVVSKGDVFPISGQNICGYLHCTQNGVDKEQNMSDYCCQEEVEDEEDVYPHFWVSLQISFPSSAALLWHERGG